MSDQTPEPYTPTLDAVRDCWVDCMVESGLVPNVETAQAAYASALAAHDREVAGRASKTAWAEGFDSGCNYSAYMESGEDRAAEPYAANPYEKAGESHE